MGFVRAVLLLQILGATSLAPALLRAEPLPQLLAMDLVIESGVEAGTARLLNELMLTEIEEARMFRVVGGADLRAIITNEQEKMLTGCTDEACLAEVAGALDTDYIAVASVGMVGSAFLVTMKIVNVKRATVLGRATMQITEDQSRLLDAVRATVARALAMSRERMGLAPVAETLTDATESDEGQSREEALGIADPEPEPDLEPEPDFAGAGSTSVGTILAWTGFGVGVALAGVGTILVATRRSQQSINDTEYRAYLDSSAADRAARYGEVKAAIDQHNSMVIAGSVLIGVGAAGALASLLSAFLMPEEVQVDATVVPGEGGAAFILGGTF